MRYDAYEAVGVIRTFQSTSQKSPIRAQPKQCDLSPLGIVRLTLPELQADKDPRGGVSGSGAKRLRLAVRVVGAASGHEGGAGGSVASEFNI